MVAGREAMPAFRHARNSSKCTMPPSNGNAHAPAVVQPTTCRQNSIQCSVQNHHATIRGEKCCSKINARNKRKTHTSRLCTAVLPATCMYGGENSAKCLTASRAITVVLAGRQRQVKRQRQPRRRCKAFSVKSTGRFVSPLPSCVVKWNV